MLHGIERRVQPDDYDHGKPGLMRSRVNAELLQRANDKQCGEKAERPPI
jgi:hypothetical protein